MKKMLTITGFALLTFAAWALNQQLGRSLTDDKVVEHPHNIEERHNEQLDLKYPEGHRRTDSGIESTKHTKDEDVQLSEDVTREFSIETDIAGPGKLEMEISLSGELVVNADRLAHVVPLTAGRVREVRRRLGDAVRRGEVMAVIDSRGLADAKAAYLAARERVALVLARFSRKEELWKKKIASEAEYLDARQALAEARIEQRSARHKLYALGLTAEKLKKLPDHPEELLTRYEISAPINGTVVAKHIALGEQLEGDANVYTISDLNNVWANLTVYQKNLAIVRKGQQVSIRADRTGAETVGVIDYVSPIVDESTRSATARVVIENTQGRWRPGMFVTGRVKVRDLEVTLAVPRSAIQTIDTRSVVFVQTRRGFELRPVEIGVADRTQVEIISGLEQGQRYVTVNGFTLKAELGKAEFGQGHGH